MKNLQPTLLWVSTIIPNSMQISQIHLKLKSKRDGFPTISSQPLPKTDFLLVFSASGIPMPKLSSTGGHAKPKPRHLSWHLIILHHCPTPSLPQVLYDFLNMSQTYPLPHFPSLPAKAKLPSSLLQTDVVALAPPYLLWLPPIDSPHRSQKDFSQSTNLIMSLPPVHSNPTCCE